MFLNPNHADSTTLGLMVFVFAPAVFLLGWLYNAHRLGKFKKAKHPAPGIAGKNTRKKIALLLFCIILGILLGLSIRPVSFH